MSIHFTQQEMHDITLECAIKTLKRADMPYIKTVALLPVLGTVLRAEMMAVTVQVFAELLNEEPMVLIDEAVKLKDAVTEAIKKAKAEKEAANV